jgi:hypothetical protein
MLTLGDFVKLANEGVPLNTPIQPVWACGPPGDMEPGVEVHEGLKHNATDQTVEMGVSLFYLENGPYPEQGTAAYLKIDYPEDDE